MYEGDTSLETLSTTENNLRDRKSFRRRRFLTLYGMRIPQYGTQSTANTLISRAYTYRNRLRLIFFEFTLRVDPIRDPLPSLHSEDLEKIIKPKFGLYTLRKIFKKKIHDFSSFLGRREGREN